MHLTVDTKCRNVSWHFYTSLPKCFSHSVLRSRNISRISATCTIIITTGFIFGLVGKMTVTEISLWHLSCNLLRKNFGSWLHPSLSQFFFFFNTFFQFGFLGRCRLALAFCLSGWEAKGLLHWTSGAFGLSSFTILAESNWPSSVTTVISLLQSSVQIVGLNLTCQKQKHDFYYFFWSDFDNSLKAGAYTNTVLGQLFHHFA